MALRIRWNAEQIHDAIKAAYDYGEARLRFDSFDEARKFRDSCYNLRRRKGVGVGLSFTIVEDSIHDWGGNPVVVAEVLIKPTLTATPQLVTAEG